MYERVLFKNIDDPRAIEIDRYVELGGYAAFRKVLRDYSPLEVVEVVKQSGLRGRGGAGFPTGMKWGFVPKNTGKPTYLCCNADESEPGTCKDRVIIEKDPHQLLEGIMIASYAVGCHLAFIYIRGEFALGYRILERAVADARTKGFLGKGIFGSSYDLEIVVHSGAGAYICGEETGLLESLEREAWASPTEAALSRGRGSLRLSDGRQQRRDARKPAAHLRAGCGVVPGPGSHGE